MRRVSMVEISLMPETEEEAAGAEEGGAAVRSRPLERALLYTPTCGARCWRRATRAAPPSAKAARMAASPRAAICQPFVLSSLDAVGDETGFVGVAGVSTGVPAGAMPRG